MDERSAERLEELSKLEAGWLDGSGDAVHSHALRIAQELLNDLSILPNLYPTEEGGIYVEWGTKMLSLEIRPNGDHRLMFYGAYLTDNE